MPQALRPAGENRVDRPSQAPPSADGGEGGRFPATTTSTLISHIAGRFRLRFPLRLAIIVMRNAIHSGGTGVETRFALTTGKVAEFTDRAELIDAQSSRFQICAIAL